LLWLEGVALSIVIPNVKLRGRPLLACLSRMLS
jgi:hypothetical protein